MPAPEVTVQAENGCPGMPIEITVEFDNEERTQTVKLNAAGKTEPVVFYGNGTARRIVVDKYNRTAKANGGMFSVHSFLAELEQTLIVYGTTDEMASNREAAEALQRAIVQRGSNYTVPIKADREVTDADVKGCHLLLIGRPDSNRLVERCRGQQPVSFGSRSFVVGRETYAHEKSAVLVAAENPQNPRFSVVVIAGLGAAATLRAAPALVGPGVRAGEVVILANGARPRALVMPARELVRELR
jgi:hypothetical protein